MRNLMLVLFALAALVAGALAFETPFVAQDDEAEEEELSEDEKTALATKAYFILRNNCWGCHGEPGKEHYGETTPLDWILDYDKLVKHKVVVPGEAGKSRLIRIILTDDMPRAFDEQGKPSKRTDLAEGELESLIDWIKAGAPKWPDFAYTHEWFHIGDLPFETNGHAKIYGVHDGLICSARSDENSLPIKHAVLLSDGWRQLETDLECKNLPLDTLVSGDGSYTWFVVSNSDERHTKAVKWRDGKFIAVGEELWGDYIEGEVLPGTEGNDFELYSGLLPLRGGKVNAYGLDNVRWGFKQGEWSKLEAPPYISDYSRESITRTSNDRVYALAKGHYSKKSISLFELVDGQWEEKGAAISAWSRGKYLLTPDAKSFCETFDDSIRLQFRSEEGWSESIPFRPVDKPLSVTWDPASERWILLGRRPGSETLAAWALIPWRKAEETD